MKEDLKVPHFKSWLNTLIFLMILFSLLIAPSMYRWGYNGLIFPGIILLLWLITAFKVEKLRKEYNVTTYRQINDLLAGKPIEKVKRTMKDNVITIVLPIVSAAISSFIVYLMMSWLDV